MREMLIGFVVGAAVVGGGLVWYAYGQYKALMGPEFAKPEYQLASKRAIEAYHSAEPGVAIWELRHVAELEEGLFGQERVYTNELRASLVMTYARLAKVYHQTGHEAEAQTNAMRAIGLLGGFRGPQTVTNLSSLLDHLKQTESRADSIQRKGGP